MNNRLDKAKDEGKCFVSLLGILFIMLSNTFNRLSVILKEAGRGVRLPWMPRMPRGSLRMRWEGGEILDSGKNYWILA